MATVEYLSGRQKYARPQALLFAEYEPMIQDGKLIPFGYEVGADITDDESFLILSDDNRSPLSMRMDRIESRKRMINGRMRSYHIADKLSLSTSWNMLPSRGYSSDPNFNTSTGLTSLAGLSNGQYTTDGGAGGVELLRWYENHTGPFWVYLAYDKYSNFDDEDKFLRLNQYNQAAEMYIADFSYSVEKRGGSNYDFWTINISLEEA